MAAGIGSLTVLLGLDAAEFTDGLSKAEQQAKKFAGTVKAMAIGEAIGSGITRGVAAAYESLKSLTVGTIDAADHLNDLSKKTGVAVETLGGIGFAAGQAGGDLESATAAAGKLNKTLAEAAAGNKKAAEFFSVLGLSAVDAAGNTKTVDVALAEIADKFAGYADGPEKAALALRAFGKAGADIIPLLDDGGQSLNENIAYFKRYSGVTTETAEKADAFNDTLGKLHVLSGAFAQTLASQLLGPLQGVADLLLESKEKGDQFRGVAEGIVDALKALAGVAATAALGLYSLARGVGGVVEAGAKLITLQGGAAKRALNQTGDDLDAAKEKFDAFVGTLYADPQKKAFTVDVSEFDNFDKKSVKKNAPGLAAKGAGDNAEALLKKQLEGQLKVIRDFAQQQNEAYQFANAFVENDYRDALIAQKDFFAQQATLRASNLAFQISALDQESAALAAARAKTAKPQDRQDLDNKIAESARKRAELITKSGQTEVLAQRESQRAAEQLQDSYQNLIASLQTLNGNDAGAAAIRIAQQVRDAGKLITQAGGDPAVVSQYKAALDNQAALAQAQTRYGRLLDTTQNKESQLYLDAMAGGKGELETLALIRDARQASIGQLEAQATAAAAFARNANTPEAIKFADDLALAFKRAKEELDPLAAQINTGLKDEFASAFEGFLEGKKSAVDALKDFGKQVLSQFASLAAKNLGEQIFGTSSQGGIGGLLSGLFPKALPTTATASGGGGASSLLSSVGNAASSFGSTVGDFFSKLGASFGFGLATGTNFVPYDGFKATLHRGEAVVPARYNPAAGGGAAQASGPASSPTIIINPPAQMDRSSSQQVAADAARAVARASRRAL